MTEIATTTPQTGSDLIIRGDQSFWNDKQIAALKQLGVKDATNGDLAVFFHHAQRTGLDPFLKQIYMIGRWSKDGTKQTIQTGIDGFRLIARRAADRSGDALAYQDMLWCGEDGVWRNAWLGKGFPAAAKAMVLRNGEPFTAVALWSEYVQTNKDGSPTAMWSRMPSNQLAKCAEALALRKAYPQDLGGIYSDDEMSQANVTVRQVPATRQPRVTAAEILGPEPDPETGEVPIDGELVDEPTDEALWPEVAAVGR